MKNNINSPMYFLDTNVLYLLSNLNSNKYNFEKIEKHCSTYYCYISIYSLFEICNNESLSLDDIKRIIDIIKKYKIKICCNNNIKSIIGENIELNIDTDEKRENLRNTLSKNIIPFYTHFFSKFAMINFFIFFMFGNKNQNEEYYKILSEFIGKLLPILDNQLSKKMNSFLQNNIFKEKELKNLYAELLSSIMFTLLSYDEQYIKQNGNIYDFKIYFNKLLNEFKKEELWDTCMRFVMKGSKNQENPILLNMYKSSFKPIYPTQADAECLFEDISNIIYGKGDNIEKIWFKYMLNKLLYNEANLETNNFIDFLIIYDFSIMQDASHLITFDGNMQKIMKILSVDKKISNSINLINIFK